MAFRRRLAASDPEPLKDEGEEEDGANTEEAEEEGANTEEEEEGANIEEEEGDVKWTSFNWVMLAIKILMYVFLQTLFIKLEFGTIFFMTSGLVFMWCSLEDKNRRADEKSAYSVFNQNCEAIQGSIKNEDIISHIMPVAKTTK